MYDKNEIRQGFLNYVHPGLCEFVSREEAYQIALHEGQLKEPSNTPGELFSEDLY